MLGNLKADVIIVSPDLLLRTSMTRSSDAVDMIEATKHRTLSMAYEDTPSVDRAIDKQAMPISQAVVRQVRIKMTARKLCKRNNVLHEVEKKKEEREWWKLQSVYLRLFSSRSRLSMTTNFHFSFNFSLEKIHFDELE